MGIDPDYKKPYDVIKAEIAAASAEITVGATYLHYKGMGPYEVVMFATREDDNELCVVYRRVDQPRLSFTRPVKEWLDQVEWEGQAVPRFCPAS